MRYIGYLKKIDKLTVALSAGMDSVAVLHFLKTKYPKLNLHAFHFNHNLRPQNNKMKRMAQKLCLDLNIPFTHKTRTYCLTEHITEDSLRKQRYQAMMGLGTVVTGHHLDDAVESYLFNCFNGTPEHLPIPVITDFGDLDLRIIRPFIISSKKELKEYVDRNNLHEYIVEDETNIDEHHRRNWLRHNLLPQINKKGYNLNTVVKKKYYDWCKKIDRPQLFDSEELLNVAP